MASIIPGFEYDIFISYRQKDNKGERWVSKFVDALKVELESTFKEEVNVYFDINPRDGLLETYDVDASINEKLKCLIFIPVISRTYCDLKSFAWENEFKAFAEQASKDQFGLKVKLPNGNIANRILPIQIHDLGTEDRALLEKELGGMIRAIEFIYKEPGVNKPLTSEDDEKKNLNGTKYIIQINKVANAIEEIISGLKGIRTGIGQEHIIRSVASNEIRKDQPLSKLKKQVKKGKLKLISGVLVIAILAIVMFFAYPEIFKKDTLDKLRASGENISVAVMPFRNMTNDSTLNIWQDGIQFNLIASLSGSPDLKVRQTELMNSLLQGKGISDYALITPAVAGKISQNLDANIFIYGNINESGGKIRISAQLIDSKTEEVFKSFQVDGDINKILKITDSLSTMIKNFLVISSLTKEISPEFQTIMPNSADAYKSFILGYKAYFRGENSSAIKLFNQSIKIDSGFVYAYFWLSIAYGNQGLYNQAAKWSLRVYEKKDQLPFEFKIWANFVYARYNEKSISEELKYAKQLLEINDRIPLTHWAVGLPYFEMHQYNNAIPELEKTLEIYKNWNVKPLNSNFYETLITAYYETGNYRKEKELLKKAFEDFPDDPGLIGSQTILYLAEGDTVDANQNINKFISLSKDNSESEATIEDDLADIFLSAGIPDKAESYYRKAVSAEPANPVRMNYLAYFLIDSDRNPDEGLKLINEALKIDPDNPGFIDTKGWGFFKQGRYKESLQLLDKADSLKPIWDYQLSVHLQSVKKSLSDKNQ